MSTFPTHFTDLQRKTRYIAKGKKSWLPRSLAGVWEARVWLEKGPGKNRNTLPGTRHPVKRLWMNRPILDWSMQPNIIKGSLNPTFTESTKSHFRWSRVSGFESWLCHLKLLTFFESQFLHLQMMMEVQIRVCEDSVR